MQEMKKIVMGRTKIFENVEANEEVQNLSFDEVYGRCEADIFHWKETIP